MIRPVLPDRTFRTGDVEIDWHHPLATRLQRCAIWNGLRGQDLVLNRMLVSSTEPNPATSYSVGLRGPGGVTTVNTQFWHYGAEGGAGGRFPTHMCTAALLRQRADTSIRNAGMFGVASNTGSRLMFSTFTDNNIYWDFGGTSSPNRISVTALSGNISTNLEAWVVVAGYRGSAIYRNGVRLAAQATAITRNTGNSNFELSGTGPSTNGDPQQLFLFLLLDTEWTPTQVAEWTTEPFALLRSGRARRWPKAVVGGGGGAASGAAAYHRRRLMSA